MATVWKAIKPQRLKSDAMRLELLNAMRRVATEIKRDFEATTATWEHKPKFESLVSLSGGAATLLVDTNDEIYRYVSEGTGPHVIRPRQAKVLHFPGTFSAKTTPGTLTSGPGSRGGTPVFTKEVHHPGTKARKFDEQIARKWTGPFKRRMEEAMRTVRDASGHAI